MVIDADTLSVGISLTTAAGLVVFIFNTATKFGALQLKVDTMWAFQIRRAMSEVVQTGLGEMNSPLVFTPEAYASLAPIKPQLIRFFDSLPDSIRSDDAESLLAIERAYGDELLLRTCVPHKLTHGACLLMALAIAKRQENKLEIRF